MNCFCSMHQDCRTGALDGCKTCAQALVSELASIGRTLDPHYSGGDVAWLAGNYVKNTGEINSINENTFFSMAQEIKDLTQKLAEAEKQIKINDAHHQAMMEAELSENQRKDDRVRAAEEKLAAGATSTPAELGEKARVVAAKCYGNKLSEIEAVVLAFGNEVAEEQDKKWVGVLAQERRDMVCRAELAEAKLDAFTSATPDSPEVKQALYQPGREGNTGKMMRRVAILSDALRAAQVRIKELSEVPLSKAEEALADTLIELDDANARINELEKKLSQVCGFCESPREDHVRPCGNCGDPGHAKWECVLPEEKKS